MKLPPAFGLCKGMKELLKIDMKKIKRRDLFKNDSKNVRYWI
jgi:hypothetical protein